MALIPNKKGRKGSFVTHIFMPKHCWKVQLGPSLKAELGFHQTHFYHHMNNNEKKWKKMAQIERKWHHAPSQTHQKPILYVIKYSVIKLKFNPIQWILAYKVTRCLKINSKHSMWDNVFKWETHLGQLQ